MNSLFEKTTIVINKYSADYFDNFYAILNKMAKFFEN